MNRMEYNPYYWRAIYKNGESLEQFDEDGNEILFEEIDQDRLKSFAWIPEDESKPSYKLELKDYQRLIAFRRKFINTRGFKGLLCYALGWQATINGINYKTIMFINPKDGSVIMREEL